MPLQCDANILSLSVFALIFTSIEIHSFTCFGRYVFDDNNNDDDLITTENKEIGEVYVLMNHIDCVFGCSAVSIYMAIHPTFFKPNL